MNKRLSSYLKTRPSIFVLRIQTLLSRDYVYCSVKDSFVWTTLEEAPLIGRVRAFPELIGREVTL